MIVILATLVAFMKRRLLLRCINSLMRRINCSRENIPFLSGEEDIGLTSRTYTFEQNYNNIYEEENPSQSNRQSSADFMTDMELKVLS